MYCDMVKDELWVTSCKLRVTSYELKAYKHNLKFKTTSSNPWVTNSNPQNQELFNRWRLKQTALKCLHFLSS